MRYKFSIYYKFVLLSLT